MCRFGRAYRSWINVLQKKTDQFNWRTLCNIQVETVCAIILTIHASPVPQTQCWVKTIVMRSYLVAVALDAETFLNLF